MASVSTKFSCDMLFMKGPCKFEARSKQRVLVHQREIHEPEALAVNAFSPGYVEPRRIHLAQVAFNPYRVLRRWTEDPQFIPESVY